MKAQDIGTIAIVGAGDMGHGIAEVCALAGLKVNLYDIKQEFVDKGRNKIKESLEKQVAKQKMTAENCSKIINSIQGFTILKDALKNIDYARQTLHSSRLGLLPTLNVGPNGINQIPDGCWIGKIAFGMINSDDLSQRRQCPLQLEADLAVFSG